MDSGWLCIAGAVILIVLLIVTVVGHGIWVAIAAIFRPRKIPPQASGDIYDLARTTVQIDELFRANLIDPATYKRVIEALNENWSRQHGAPPVPVLPISTPQAEPAAMPVAAQAPLPPSVPPPLPIAPPRPRAPRRSLSDVFAAFMRDSNIRWGELVGGMLIVGCSVALVISFWSEIAHHSFLQFAIFTSVTAAMLGLGLYAEHRWKLPTTSRGILLIATLLVPLNFLAFAALSHGARPSLVETGIEIAALVLFGFLIWRAAAVLAPYWPNLLTVGVLGISAMLLGVQHFGPARSTIALFGLPAIALVIYGGDTAFMLIRASRWRHIRQHAAEAMYLLLGVLTFAAALAVGLVILQSVDPWNAAHRLSPLLSLAMTPALATGLLVWRKMSDVRLSRTRTAGTAIAVAAAFAMLGAIALAWPDPASLLPLCIADFVVFTIIAFALAIPAAHALAAPCLLLAYLIGFHIMSHRIGWSSTGAQMIAVLLSPDSGAALLPLLAIAVAIAWLLRRLHGGADAAVYRIFARAIAIVSLFLIPHVSIVASHAIGARLAWIAGILLVAGFEEKEKLAFVAAQILLAGAVTFLTLGHLANQAWFAGSHAPLLEPWTLQIVGVALAALGLIFALARMLFPLSFASRWFEQALVGAPTVGLAAILVIVCVQGAADEFATKLTPVPAHLWSHHAIGPAAWLLLTTLLVVATLWFVESRRFGAVVFWLIVALLACPLVSGRWMDQTATASALRWSLAFFLLLTSIPLWMREPLRWVLRTPLTAPAARDMRLLLVFLCAVPILGLSMYPASLIVEDYYIRGPAVGSSFAKIGERVSYALPLAIVAVCLLVNAIREKSSGWAFVSSIVCNMSITWSGTIAKWHTASDHFLLELVQLNVLMFGAFSLLWLLARAATGAKEKAPILLRVQITLALIGNWVLLFCAATAVFIAPLTTAGFAAHVGHPIGWLALIAGFAAWGLAQRDIKHPSAAFVATALAAAGLMIAFAAQTRDSGNWLSYHLMLVGAVVSAGGIVVVWLLIRRQLIAVSAPAADVAATSSESDAVIPLQYYRRPLDASSRAALYLGGQLPDGSFLGWIFLLTICASILALRAMLGDPQRPWWSSNAMLVLCLLWTGVSWWVLAPGLLYPSVMLLMLGAGMWWVERPGFITSASLDLSAVVVIVLAVFGAASLVLHVQVFRKIREERLPLHRFAAVATTIIMLVLAVAMVWVQVAGSSVQLVSPTKWAALGTTALLLTMALTDPKTTFAPAGLYLLGLIVIAMSVSQIHPPASRLSWSYGLAAAAFVLISSVVYAFRDQLAKLLEALGFPAREDTAPPRWVVMANTMIAVVVIALAAQVDFTVNQTLLRLTAASAALAPLIGLVLCARDDERIDLRQAVILLATAGAVVFAWAWLAPASVPIDRLVATMLALSASGLICGAIHELGARGAGRAEVGAPEELTARQAPRSPGNLAWLLAARMMLPVLTLLWALNAAALVGAEIFERSNTGSLHLSGWSIVCPLLILIGASVLSIMLALRKQNDPLRIPLHRRSAYVYASEALLAMIFVHLRLTMPWLFGGIFSQYWPLLVMALAFAGVGLAELLRRWNTIVLSEPLNRTGIFLPLLPVLAFWLAPSQVDFSNLLFVVGFFYAVLSATRKSFLFGVVAALAANGGLWALLYRHPELRFLVHPQLWMIPAALSVLIAAQLNRDRLAESHLRFIRYACLMLVYVSSTADIFLNGVRDHPWLPLVLAALSVAGVLIGMLFRLRAFLFLGTSFLAIAIITMIYYASANLHWTWLWYVAGIALGAGIIVVFALFEKKRTEMLALVEGLKQWQ